MVVTGRLLLLALPLGVVFEFECRVVFGFALLPCPAAILVLRLRDECRVADAETVRDSNGDSDALESDPGELEEASRALLDVQDGLGRD